MLHTVLALIKELIFILMPKCSLLENKRFFSLRNIFSNKIRAVCKNISKVLLIYVYIGVCLQWDSNRAPGVRGGAAAAGGPTREYMPVADKVRSGKT